MEDGGRHCTAREIDRSRDLGILSEHAKREGSMMELERARENEKMMREWIENTRFACDMGLYGPTAHIRH